MNIHDLEFDIEISRKVEYFPQIEILDTRTNTMTANVQKDINFSRCELKSLVYEPLWCSRKTACLETRGCKFDSQSVG